MSGRKWTSCRREGTDRGVVGGRREGVGSATGPREGSEDSPREEGSFQVVPFLSGLLLSE